MCLSHLLRTSTLPDAANSSRADKQSDDKEAPPIRRRRIQSSAVQTPHISAAQVPPPPPRPTPPTTPVVFGRRQLLGEPASNGDCNGTISYPTTTIELPPFQIDDRFEQWLREHQLIDQIPRIDHLRRDLEYRRRFLMEGHLTQEEQDFVVAQIPAVYLSRSHYLFALAGLALLYFDHDQSIALLFCFSKMRKDAVGNLLDLVIQL